MRGNPSFIEMQGRLLGLLQKPFEEESQSEPLSDQDEVLDIPKANYDQFLDVVPTNVKVQKRERKGKRSAKVPSHPDSKPAVENTQAMEMMPVP